ncbi:TIGR03620 family F420-dependent LLM class oxidoreductase [Nonomuraea longicatena]|uniref:TIGR03620 family F420-dependent LLM class oxidoreductase n=1 Tax=Nonomuraea longicatena TaxID=83682 RepID=A0ABP3Z3J8_9ACTN
MEGRIGVWHAKLGSGPTQPAREAAAEIEAMGYGSVWVNEAPGGRAPFTSAAVLLAATERVSVATGIASIWARDAAATAAESDTLGDAFPGRFVLGLGVSHDILVQLRGHDYSKPLAAMRAYLTAMDTVETDVPEPARPAPRLLAALRPRMLELAREHADGAHPYFVPLEHTALAREILGPDRLLVPEQAVLVEPDPDTARRVAREHMSVYLMLPNYVNNLRTLGFDDADFADGGSDRLVDALVAWGDEEAVAARVHAHLAAGADHVAIQPLTAGGPDLADALTQLRRLSAPLL